jgi:endonuclease YncB( thermonuclease family)
MSATLRTLLGGGLACLLAVSALPAQNTEPAKSGVQFDFSKDRCGNPMMESMGWHSIEGTVSKVVDGRTILLTRTDDHQILRVHLAAIATEPRRPFSRKARELLGEKLLHKAVDVWVNPDKWNFSDKHPGKVTGVVHLSEGNPIDAGLLLLSEGLVRFKRPRPYTMSDFTACQYGLAEAEAQSKKLGLWQ